MIPSKQGGAVLRRDRCLDELVQLYRQYEAQSGGCVSACSIPWCKITPQGIPAASWCAVQGGSCCPRSCQRLQQLYRLEWLRFLPQRRLAGRPEHQGEGLPRPPRARGQARPSASSMPWTVGQQRATVSTTGHAPAQVPTLWPEQCGTAEAVRMCAWCRGPDGTPLQLCVLQPRGIGAGTGAHPSSAHLQLSTIDQRWAGSRWARRCRGAPRRRCRHGCLCQVCLERGGVPLITTCPPHKHVHIFSHVCRLPPRQAALGKLAAARASSDAPPHTGPARKRRACAQPAAAGEEHGAAGEGAAWPWPKVRAAGRKRRSPEPAGEGRRPAPRRRRSSAAVSPAGTSPAPTEAPGSSDGRRVPARLAPWACSACTLTNAGPAAACSACGTPCSAARAPGAPGERSLRERRGGAPIQGQRRRRGAAAAGGGVAREQAAPVGGGARPMSPALVRPPEAQQARGGREPRTRRWQGRMSAAAACDEAPEQSAGPGQAPAGRSRQARQSSAGGVHPGGSRSATPRCARSAAAQGTGSLTPLSGGRMQTQAAGSAGGRWRAQQPRWVLLASQLGAPESAALGRMAAAAGARIAPRWEPGVTHVVCGVTRAGAARRTFKFLMAVLGARWALAPSWLAACEAAAGAAPEEPHEARWPAPRLCCRHAWSDSLHGLLLASDAPCHVASLLVGLGRQHSGRARRPRATAAAVWRGRCGATRRAARAALCWAVCRPASFCTALRCSWPARCASAARWRPCCAPRARACSRARPCPAARMAPPWARGCRRSLRARWRWYCGTQTRGPSGHARNPAYPACASSGSTTVPAVSSGCPLSAMSSLRWQRAAC